MKAITLLSVVILAATTISCKEEKQESVLQPAENAKKTYNELKKADWLLGSWGHSSPEGTLAENWTKVTDSSFKGESFFIANREEYKATGKDRQLIRTVRDTVFTEYIELIEANGKLVYTVSVTGQNNEKPVPFELTSSTGTELIFENPKHDFPNKITYNKYYTDSLVAVISGIQDGKPTTQTFAMKRKY